MKGSVVIAKLAAHGLPEPMLATANLRLVCHEAEFDQLLGELALHHLGLVPAGQGAPRNPSLRLSGERLVDAPVERYGPMRMPGQTERSQVPQSLNDLPVLLPTGHSALRTTLEHSFETHGLRPRVVGEFEDRAPLAVFAARGLGVFPASHLAADDIGLMRGHLLGNAEGMKQEIHAIRSRRGRHHPLLQKLMAAAAAGTDD